MGYIRHHAIIVTSWDTGRLAAARDEAILVFGNRVTDIVESAVNTYATFLIGPDGSKEGWDASANGDIERDEFIKWLDRQRYDDGSSWLSWVEVQYGDDDLETKVCRDSDAVRRAFAER